MAICETCCSTPEGEELLASIETQNIEKAALVEQQKKESAILNQQNKLLEETKNKHTQEAISEFLLVVLTFGFVMFCLFLIYGVVVIIFREAFSVMLPNPFWWLHT